ncbi:MAG: UDP-N-acetylmuramoyl-L-alanyl-D-glutamate--2,6-diaminopimelate ligase [Ruminococcaceae bacterium]|nr:UDP-N-acetylmuramoyl-L-alanyl-D-glutamate--2,6-diaminopimelate ligase [Oscillospiraceae bacterium]
MKLKDLTAGLDITAVCADLEMEITGVTYDSRKVRPGNVFVAITGFATDGNLYVQKAMAQGAVAVITAKPQPEGVPYVQVKADRIALAQVGANYYDHPGEAMKVIGITGTNGKTSSTLLLKHVIEQTLGAKVGLMGTMENMIGQERIPTERTTPESLDLQALLGQMRDGGCTYAIMEVSSHAIALERVGGLTYEVAAFTNLTEDHLDFHETMENYCDTKAQIFSRCRNAVVNADDPWAKRICKNGCCEPLYTSAREKTGLYAENVTLLSDGVRFTAVHEDSRVTVEVGIPGKFTVYNVLTVLGCALKLGISLEAAAKALQTAQGVKGRVEVVPTPGKPYTVLIDYAHTPDGLENVLSSVRGFCQGRLIAVFGCGGDRDPMKRPIMGRIGAELADIAVITSDNPRTEEPGKIIADILAGVDREKYSPIVIENRVEAIRYAMDIGENRDIIILAGKGHETYQEICGVKYPMDERQIVAEYLEKTRK